MSNLLITNGQLIDPANNINQLADIHIINGKIAAIGPANSIMANDSSQIIDASNLIIIPGLVDCCARLREPGLEHKATIYSEVIAATNAGITTLCCPPDTNPVIDEPAVVELINQKMAIRRPGPWKTAPDRPSQSAEPSAVCGPHPNLVFALQ